MAAASLEVPLAGVGVAASLEPLLGSLRLVAADRRDGGDDPVGSGACPKPAAGATVPFAGSDLALPCAAAAPLFPCVAAAAGATLPCTGAGAGATVCGGCAWACPAGGGRRVRT